MTLFKPKEIIDRFDKLDIDSLKDRGFKAVFIDIDNTITAPNTGDFNDEAVKFVEGIKKAGMRPIICSNNVKKRVEEFIGNHDVDYRYFSLKPLPFMFWNACKKYNIKPHECVVLGDQLMTDMLGANLSGCYGIYSKQLQEKDTPLTKINRFFENIVWRFIDDKKM